MIEIIGLLLLLFLLGVVALIFKIFAPKTRKTIPANEKQIMTAEEKLEKFFGELLAPLVNYCTEPNGSYKEVIKELHDGEIPQGNSYYGPAFFDIVNMINAIALPEDEVRSLDRCLVHSAAWIFIMPWKDDELDELDDLIREEGTEDIIVPYYLMRIGSSDFSRVIDIYSKLAEFIVGVEPGAGVKRKAGYLRFLKQMADLQEEHLENLKQTVDLQKERLAHTENSAYTVLNVEPGCSLDDLESTEIFI